MPSREGRRIMRHLLLLLSMVLFTGHLVAAPLTYSVSTDRSVYEYRDFVNVTITARNLGSLPDTLWFFNGCETDYHIDSLDFMHHDSISFMCAAIIHERIIQPHDSVQWVDSPGLGFMGERLGAGRHAVVAEVHGYWTSDTLWINVLGPTGVNGGTPAPKMYELWNNFPNPFNPTTVISFSIPKQSDVLLKVYDVLGREVASLLDESKFAGHYNVTFDASSLPSGVYFYWLRAGEFVQVKKMLLMR
jgi:hypothetical protein